MIRSEQRGGMLTVETIGRIRREHLQVVQGMSSRASFLGGHPSSRRAAK
jgi:hypothetical protein